MNETVFLIIWLCFAVFIIFSIFTKRGHKLAIELQFRCKILSDLGEIKTEDMTISKQKLRLYECQRDTKIFYVLDVKQTSGIGFNICFIKFDSFTLKEMNRLIK